MYANMYVYLCMSVHMCAYMHVCMCLHVLGSVDHCNIGGGGGGYHFRYPCIAQSRPLLLDYVIGGQLTLATPTCYHRIPAVNHIQYHGAVSRY